jgi:hypothetical protein
MNCKARRPIRQSRQERWIDVGKTAPRQRRIAPSAIFPVSVAMPALDFGALFEQVVGEQMAFLPASG